MSSVDRFLGAAGDASDARGSLPLPLTSLAIRSAMQGQLRAASGSTATELRRFATLLCSEGRRRGLRAEQLIVLLKQTWLTLPEATTAARSTSPRLLDQLIGLCIEEY